MTHCPCGSGADLDECCRPILGGAPAPTAEALMRSRYTAFVRGDRDHIENTYAWEARAREARDNVLRPGVTDALPSVEWVGLKIFDIFRGGVDDDAGMVEFAARYRKDGALLVHRERSNFRREDGRWVYVDGDVIPKVAPEQVGKTGRNQPCPCRSVKKFKKCCGV